jgi:hypothetical protein
MKRLIPTLVILIGIVGLVMAADYTPMSEEDTSANITRGNITASGTLGVTGVATFTAESVHNSGIDADGITVDASDGIDTKTAGTLLIGAATATKIEVGLTAVETEVQGTLDVIEAADFDAAVTIGTTLGVTGETTLSGKYAVVGPDASTGLMILQASITAPNQALVTNAFATTFGAAPVVTASYTEDPGDVRPIFVSSVASNQVVFGITADKNYAYTAVGTRP